MQRLPLEISKLILSELDDFSSLPSSILSCHALHSAFTSDPSGIATQVLVNQVGIYILPEAIAAFESSRLRPQSKVQDALDLTAQHFDARATPSISATPAEAASFAQLDVYVRNLARLFANDCLAKSPTPEGEGGDAGPSSSPAPTPTETDRIRRALYRFEAFCNLCRRVRPSVPIPNERLDEFCKRFSPCENEQLACIQDFLFRLASPAFNELAAHDVAWGEHRADPVLRPGAVTFQGVLSLGLATLYRLASAESYEARHAQLASEHPPVRPDFIHRALTRANSAHGGIRPPFFNDCDPGPAAIWEWAHPSTATQCSYQPDRAYLREWGYVLWDKARIDRTQVLQSPWQPRPIHLRDEQALDVADERWLGSWTRRSQIYSGGGRGCIAYFLALDLS
ncbi:hypothetical protein ACJ41O_005962 [Fusarium nematophilum]